MTACDALRGNMDASEYKEYIFGMLFLKHASDLFDERREAIKVEGKAAGLGATSPPSSTGVTPRAWSGGDGLQNLRTFLVSHQVLLEANETIQALLFKAQV